MNEIELKVGRRTYRLTNTNGKYGRAISDAGPRAKPWHVLAFYDAHGGYIQDENGQKIDNGPFRTALKEWSEGRIKRKQFLTSLDSWFRHPIIVSMIVALLTLIAIIVYWRIYGIDLRAPLPAENSSHFIP